MTFEKRTACMMTGKFCSLEWVYLHLKLIFPFRVLLPPVKYILLLHYFTIYRSSCTKPAVAIEAKFETTKTEFVRFPSKTFPSKDLWLNCQKAELSLPLYGFWNKYNIRCCCEGKYSFFNETSSLSWNLGEKLKSFKILVVFVVKVRAAHHKGRRGHRMSTKQTTAIVR